MSAWRRWVALGLFLTGCQVGDELFTFPFLQQNNSGADGGRTNHPPELTVVLVAPLQTGVGSTITLSARARDPDGDLVTYHWTGTGGEIEQPRAADTTYMCKDKGHHAVAIVVRDSGGLTAVSVIDIDCV
jgi:hypothetical protein